MKVIEEMKKIYMKQGYHFIGKYALIKPCHWLRRSLITKGIQHCYKQKFYGIPSHRCLQLSPTIACTQRCLYCWRVQAADLGLVWNDYVIKDYDNPEDIVLNGILMQRQILSGFKGNPKVNAEILEEAFRPIHAAISLVGEPTLYPRIGELIAAFFRHGFKTTFLVTNGTLPEALSNIECEPSQLYVSLSAPNENIYRKLCRPKISDGWKRLKESLEILGSFSCPTVIRITLVKGWNMQNPEEYAKIIDEAEPTYVEVKAAMSLGGSRLRLPIESMPKHEEVKAFGMKIGEAASYNLIDEAVESRIILLSKLEKPIKLI